MIIVGRVGDIVPSSGPSRNDTAVAVEISTMNGSDRDWIFFEPSQQVAQLQRGVGVAVRARLEEGGNRLYIRGEEFQDFPVTLLEARNLV